MSNEEGMEEIPVVDVEHPWAEASAYIQMQPLPCLAKFDTVEMTVNGKKVNAALLTVADPGGVSTNFLTGQQLNQLLMNGAVVLQELAGMGQNGQIHVAKDMSEADQIAKDINNLFPKKER